MTATLGYYASQTVEAGAEPNEITETWTGSNGNPWPDPPWSVTNPASAATATATIQGNRGRLSAGGGTYAFVLAELVGSDHTDMDVTFTYAAGDTTEKYVNIFYRGHIGPIPPGGLLYPVSCYVLDIETNGDLVMLQWVDDESVPTTLATVTTAGVNVTTDLNVRIQVIGTAHKAKWWTGTEPGTWQIEETDATITASGTFMLGFYSGNNTDTEIVEFDNLTFTTPGSANLRMLKGVGGISDGSLGWELTALNCSWWYSWDNYSVTAPHEYVPGYEYVPMMWGDWENEIRFDIGGDSASSIGSSKVLLGFNEPDITAQSNVTVARALELWPDLEATGVRLGSPAPAGDDTTSQAWLADFLNGDGLGYVPRVDFICCHWYVEYDSGFTDFGDFLDYLHDTYGKPVWVTEIGTLDGTEADNAALMDSVFAAIAERPFVERVAWYVTRGDLGDNGIGSGLITDGGGSLTVAGVEYATHPAVIHVTGEATPTAPDAPTSLSASPGDTQVSLTWTAPVDDGGSAITTYSVQYRTPAGSGGWSTFTHGASTTPSITVTSLTNDSEYEFQVAAVNAIGTGSYSSTDTATPVAASGSITPTPFHHDVTAGEFAGFGNDQFLVLPSWSVTAGDLLVIALGGEMGEDGGLTPSTTAVVSGGTGLTWHQEAPSGASANNPFQAMTSIWWAVAPSTTSITGIRIDIVLDMLVFGYEAIAYAGTDTSDPIGVSGNVFIHDNTELSDGQHDVTLSGAPAASSYVLGIAFVNATDTSPDKAMTHGVSDGFTEIYDSGPDMTGTNQYGSYSVQHRTGWTTARVRWDDTKEGTGYTTFSLSASAVEIKAAP